MSDPRIITADQARSMRGAASEGVWAQGKGGVEVFAVTPHSRSFVADTGSHIPREHPDVIAEARADAELIAAAPDLAHTVIEQDADIVDLVQEVNDHHHDLLRVMEERNGLSAQIRRVCELLDQMAEDNGKVADSLGSEYAKGKHYAYANAAKFIRGVAMADMTPEQAPTPPTMAETEWSDEEHHLAEALFGDTRKVVMLARDTGEEGDWSEWVHCRMEDGSTELIEKAYLTPTGRKYLLEPEAAEQNNAERDDEPVFDPAYLYRDKDGETWEYLDGKWVQGDSRMDRLVSLNVNHGLNNLLPKYGPYTRIEKDTK